jgi:hypothetical protein
VTKKRWIDKCKAAAREATERSSGCFCCKNDIVDFRKAFGKRYFEDAECTSLSSAASPETNLGLARSQSIALRALVETQVMKQEGKM